MDDRGTREGKQDVLDAWHFPNGPRAETRPSVSVVVLVVDRDLLAPLGGGPTVGVPGVIGSPVVCRGDVSEPADVPDEVEGDVALPVPAPETPAPPAPPPADSARLGPAATRRTTNANANGEIVALGDTILSFLEEFAG